MSLPLILWPGEGRSVQIGAKTTCTFKVRDWVTISAGAGWMLVRAIRYMQYLPESRAKVTCSIFKGGQT